MFDHMCLVLDMGGEQSRSIARKMRGEHVYCEILPYNTPIERIVKRAPRGLIIAGGDGNPFAEGAIYLPEEVYALGLPMLGLGYGAGVLLRHDGAKLSASQPGRQTIEVHFEDSPLFEDLSESERLIERLDKVEPPEGWTVVATAGDSVAVGFEDAKRKRWALPFYPEQNDPDGLRILGNFAAGICGCERSWTIERFLENEVEYIRARAGDGQVLMTLSGGVDSAVCAALLGRALGDRLSCLHVDNGLLRAGETDLIRMFGQVPGITVRCIECRERFLHCLRGVTEPEEKRSLVMDELVRVFEDYAETMGHVECLAQGTIYDDILDMPHQPAAERERLSLRVEFNTLLEPVSRLFKDEVRLLGEALGLPDDVTRKQAFPGAGLAVRCQGEVTEEKLSMLRAADRIFCEEVAGAGLDRRIRQYFAILCDLHTDDAQGRPGYTVALRAVNWNGSPGSANAYRMPYDLLERVVGRITDEVHGVNRVVYDLTGKPPAGIEWD